MDKEFCLFCGIAKKEIPAKIAYEDDAALAFEDINPKAPVHLLVIPKLHIERVSDIREDGFELVGHLISIANRLAESRKIKESGYRLILNCNKDAGQEVFHLHLHLLGGRKFSWPPG
ncbi:MAG: histidine triad nucleotide-binding protein [Candidatus Omnitrophota bacterium]